MNVGLLLYFKYANFFVDNINSALLSLNIGGVSWSKVLLPIGISFYTFQTLTYSIDVYRRVHKPLSKVTDYLLYIMMFPQMIAGPIVRFNTIADEINDRDDSYEDKINGFYRFCIGLGKKVLIANELGLVADQIIGSEISDITTGTAWIGIISYTFQIYFDFSGYSDMAIGLGRMMGFSFPENFKNPYTSRSITHFWQQWHITLGDWMRDYLYIPLGGNRVSPSRTYINLWLVFLVSGLWHGASWNFVLWGIYHGFFLVVERLFLGKTLNKLGVFMSVIYTFITVVIGWVIFRIEDFDRAILYYKKLFSIGDFSVNIPLNDKFWVVLIIAIIFSFFVLFPYGKRVQDLVFDRHRYPRQLLYRFVISLILFVISIGAITTSDFNPFIYFKF